MKATITLKLGNRCNFQCRHCCQGEYKEQVAEDLAINPDIFDYIHKEATEWVARDRSVNNKAFADEKTTLRLWGGEPLMYLPQIKQVVQELKKSPVQLAITTNGSLLTQEIVDYVNEEDIHVALSNDGADTAKIRLINVLEDERLVGLFRQIKKRSVTAVLHAYSQDLFQTWSYILGRVGQDTAIYTELLMAVQEIPKDICAFDNEGFADTMDRSLRDLNLSEKTPNYNFLSGQLSNMLVGALNSSNPLAPYCRQGFQAVCLDLQGNIYPCHNFGEALGDIYLNEKELNRRYTEIVRPVYRFAECLECEVFAFCRGHCPFVKPSANKEKCCEVRKIFFNGLARYINSYEAKGKEV